MRQLPSLGPSLAAGEYMLASAELDNNCEHGKCTTGGALAADTSACVTSICAADSFCCSSSWDSLCVGEVRTICGSLTCAESEGTCNHPLCTASAPLVSACDSTKANCATSICTADPFCCS